MTLYNCVNELCQKALCPLDILTFILEIHWDYHIQREVNNLFKYVDYCFMNSFLFIHNLNICLVYHQFFFLDFFRKTRSLYIFFFLLWNFSSKIEWCESITPYASSKLKWCENIESVECKTNFWRTYLQWKNRSLIAQDYRSK